MITQSRKKIARKLCIGVVSLATVGLSMGGAATSASASPVDGSAATHRTTLTQSGSGTVSDPWIPSRNAHTDCSPTGLWGNYNNGTWYNYILGMPYNAYIVVRYITPDGVGADSYYVNGGQWGFVNTRCFHFT